MTPPFPTLRSSDLTCSTWHSIGGEGRSIGPDLSNLVFRDYESVFRDISDPGATINPDFLAHTVTTKDGDKLTGFMSYKKDSVVIRDIGGDRKSTRLNSSHYCATRMPSSA